MQLPPALGSFYSSTIKKIDRLKIKLVLKRKNPRLFRSKAMNRAAEIVEAILSAFVSSAEETIFGNVFFKPITVAVA